MSKWLVLTAIIASLTTSQIQAQSAAPAGQKSPRLVLVELFTSEGCSSCPPADEVLRKLHNTRPDANTQIIGLSEHVTYWNRLGWADRFSTSTFTDRQSDYGERFHLSSVYTPQIVVNGEREVLGSDGNAVLKAVRGVAPASPLSIHIVSAKVSNNKLEVSYQVDGAPAGLAPDLYAAITDDAVSTRVLRGENAGRSLTHVSVARSLVQLDAQPTTIKTARLMLPFAQDGASGAGRHLILFAQEPHSGRVLSVETRPF